MCLWPNKEVKDKVKQLKNELSDETGRKVKYRSPGMGCMTEEALVGKLKCQEKSSWGVSSMGLQQRGKKNLGSSNSDRCDCGLFMKRWATSDGQHPESWNPRAGTNPPVQETLLVQWSSGFWDCPCTLDGSGPRSPSNPKRAPWVGHS